MASADKAYAREDRRWGYLAHPGLPLESAKAIVKAWARKYRVPMPAVMFTDMEVNEGYCTHTDIVLSMYGISPLLVAHEFAHYVWDRTKKRGEGNRYHNKRHANIVDRLCLDFIKHWL
jgi:hypothetical protein